MTKTKQCPICKNRFTYKSNKKRFDSEACRKVAERRKKHQQRPCQVCNTPFPITKGNQKYCSRQCAKKADNTTQKLRHRAEEAAKEILSQRKADAANANDLAALEQVSNSPGRLPKVQALEDQAGAERAQIVRNAKPAFDIFDIREFYIEQQRKEQQSPQGQGPSIDTLRRIKASQDGTDF